MPENRSESPDGTSGDPTNAQANIEQIRARLSGWHLVALGILVGGLLVVTAQSPIAASVVTPNSDADQPGQFLMHATDNPIPSTGDVDQPLRIAAADIHYMNRISRERSHEIGYCGLIESGQLRPWLADTVRADETGLEYVTDNCPGTVRAVLHTHPNGNTLLSGPDVRELRAAPQDIMCVHAGQITTEHGARTDRLRCYQLHQSNSSTALHEVPVVVGKARAS